MFVIADHLSLIDKHNDDNLPHNLIRLGWLTMVHLDIQGVLRYALYTYDPWRFRPRGNRGQQVGHFSGETEDLGPAIYALVTWKWDFSIFSWFPYKKRCFWARWVCQSPKPNLPCAGFERLALLFTVEANHFKSQLQAGSFSGGEWAAVLRFGGDLGPSLWYSLPTRSPTQRRCSYPRLVMLLFIMLVVNHSWWLLW